MHKKNDAYETAIQRPVLLKASRFRSYVYGVLSVVTMGVIPLVFYWFKHLEKYLYVPTQSTCEADHVLITSSATKQQTIARLNFALCRFLPHQQLKPRYYFHYKKHLYYLKEGEVKVLHNRMLHSLKKNPRLVELYYSGLTQAARNDMNQVYKANLIEVESDSVFLLFLKEVCSPYTIFQIMAIVIWAIDNYLLYAYVIMLMMAMAIGTAVYEQYSQSKRMNEMTYINEQVDTLVPASSIGMLATSRLQLGDLKDGSFARLMSKDLTVGDIIKVHQGETVTADVLLLTGKCLMNEAMLTGETVPVTKRSFSGHTRPTDLSIVYAGTECIVSHSAIGLVINTGFYTKKGEIIRTLLFTEHKEFRFKTDAFRLLGVIFLVVTCFFVLFVLIVESSIYRWYYRGWGLLIRGAELFTVAVPPILPLAITIGLEIASQRLRAKRVYSLSLEKINQAGRVRLVCFDKTGTLTQNTLNFRGVLPLYNPDEDWDVKVSEGELAEQFVGFNQFYSDMEAFELENTVSPFNRNYMLYECMACCHSLELHNGELIGDPIEVQLFNQTAFSLRQTSKGDHETVTTVYPDEYFAKKMKLRPGDCYAIEQIFDFTSERKRMSVVTNLNGRRRLFLKGAPEVVKSLCFSQNLPFNFEDELTEFTEQGFRVLALAYRDIELEEITESLEQGVQFLGFVIFENPLKPESKETITQLNACGVKSTIVTGDNLFTAISVGISLHMFNYSSRVFIATLREDGVDWEEIENETHRRERGASIHADEHSYMPSRKSSLRSGVTDLKDSKGTLSVVIKECFKDNCVICITGEAFEHLFKHANMRRKTYQKLLDCIYIFGRTSPSQKALVVSKYQEHYAASLKIEWFVGFCGDGANDSEALKQADVGVSLSHSEAVLAATFNTTRDNVSCLLDLFIEAKCSLETSLQNAKYVLFYSLLQFICVLMAYTKAEEYNNMAYFTWDIIIFVPLSMLMNRTEALPELNTHSPATSLLNKELMVSLFGQLGLSGLFIILLQMLSFGYSTNLEIYEITGPTERRSDSMTYRDTQALVFYASMLTAWSAVFFSRGYPFKQPVRTNKALIGWVIVCTVYVFLMTFIKYLELPYRLAYSFNYCAGSLREEFDFTMNYVVITCAAVVISYAAEKRVFSKRMDLNRRNRAN